VLKFVEQYKTRLIIFSFIQIAKDDVLKEQQKDQFIFKWHPNKNITTGRLAAVRHKGTKSQYAIITWAVQSLGTASAKWEETHCIRSLARSHVVGNVTRDNVEGFSILLAPPRGLRMQENS
jgi:hypothetical protein